MVHMNLDQMETREIIHESKWAITERCGNKVRKEFLHDAYPKIQKEVMLLKLSVDKEAELYYDYKKQHWICESEYMDLFSIVNTSQKAKTYIQLDAIFQKWQHDIRYKELVPNDWCEVAVPWYCGLLRRYIPDSECVITWLQQSRGEHFIHGDLILSNIYMDIDGQLVILDFENATIGPLLWDEATLVYSLIEHKEYAMAREVFDTFHCEKNILYVISCIRLAQSIRKSQNVQQRMEACEYISREY